MGQELAFVEAVPRETASRLDEGSIHLWRMSYDPSLRRRPLIALLADYLGLPESAITLDEDAKGKPRLPSVRPDPTRARRAGAMPTVHHAGQAYPPGVGAARSRRPPGQPNPREADTALSFNWSHSGEYALVALARHDAVGVDIERLDKKARVLDVAHRFFDPAEAALLASLDPVSRQRAFIGLWCEKEALLKAAGVGISFGLARLAFASPDGRDWTLARVDAALGEASAWHVPGFAAAPGYRGALAWRGRPKRIFAFDLRHVPRSG